MVQLGDHTVWCWAPVLQDVIICSLSCQPRYGHVSLLARIRSGGLGIKVDLNP